MNRLEIKRAIQSAGDEFSERMWTENHELGNIAWEFMGLNVEYVINHQGEDETYGTLDILKTGYTKNQKRFLERLGGWL
jgi:hypothetical protein